MFGVPHAKYRVGSPIQEPPSRMATGELDELRALFASPSSSSAGSPPRETALPLTRIAKFGVADENRRLAEQGRMAQDARKIGSHRETRNVCMLPARAGVHAARR